jgi:hypothetical protein
MIQLVPPLPREVISGKGWEGPIGEGVCNVLIDYGLDHDLIWVVEMDLTGEIWCVPNRFVRAVRNVTAGRNTAKVLAI